MAENPGVRNRRAEPPWGYGAPKDAPPPPRPPKQRSPEEIAQAILPGLNAELSPSASGGDA